MLIILAVLDLIATLTLALVYFGIAIKFLIIASAIYLIVKGMIFLGDPASIIDIIIALGLFISLAITLPKIVILIFGIFLLQKALFSFVS
jgi:hypothetical protein